MALRSLSISIWMLMQGDSGRQWSAAMKAYADGVKSWQG
jgi:hypothetical protein